MRYWNTVPGWFNEEDLKDNFDHLNNNDIIVELGSFFGRSSSYIIEELVKRNLTSKFYAIDLFVLTPDGKDGDMPFGGSSNAWEKENGKEAMLKEFLRYYTSNPNYNKDNHFYYQRDSFISEGFEDNSVGLIWIDASHKYENVKKDLDAWHNKIRPGGLMVGHDWEWQGVKDAVTEYGNKYGLHIQTQGASWKIQR